VKEPREERKPARRAPAKKTKDTSASKEAPVAAAEAPAADVKKPVKRVRKASAPAAEKPAS
jgi:hypothetical protein